MNRPFFTHLASIGVNPAPIPPRTCGALIRRGYAVRDLAQFPVPGRTMLRITDAGRAALVAERTRGNVRNPMGTDKMGD